MRSLLLLLLCAGCSAPVRDYRGEFVPAIAVACGVATVTHEGTPDTPSDVCQTCDGKGRLPIRDTGTFEDCPDCDKNPSLSPPPPAAPQDASEGHDAPAVEWLTWDEAAELSRLTTRPVLVFQCDNSDDSKKLDELLTDKKTLAAVAKLGILCSDTAARWQPNAKEPKAPAVAYVKPDAKPGESPPFKDSLRVDSASALLQQLKAWINAIEGN